MVNQHTYSETFSIPIALSTSSDLPSLYTNLCEKILLLYNQYYLAPTVVFEHTYIGMGKAHHTWKQLKVPFKPLPVWKSWWSWHTRELQVKKKKKSTKEAPAKMIL